MVVLAGVEWVVLQLVDTTRGRSIRWETGVAVGEGIAPDDQPYSSLLMMLQEQLKVGAEDLVALAACPAEHWSKVRTLYIAERFAQVQVLVRSLSVN